MATLNEKIRRAIQDDEEVETAFEKLIKSRCDEDVLIKKIGRVAGAYGMAGIGTSLKKKGVTGIPGNMLPERRQALADMPGQLRKMANRIEKVNASPINPVRFSRRVVAGSDAGVVSEEIAGVLRVVADSGDSLPPLLRAYAVALAAASRLVPKLLPKDSFEQIAADAEVPLINYVKKVTGRPHWSEVSSILAAGLSVLGKYAPDEGRFLDPTTLRMRYRSASRRGGFLGQR